MDHERLALLLLVLFLVYPSSSAYDFEHCKNSVKQWASSSLHSDTKDGHILKDLLFFLHVPRTGGRTYFHCFLKKLYSSALECPRSYDKLRFNPRKPGCRLLVTHDDYSMVSKLPGEKTSVVTILRDPIERVFSAYEFSIEVGARFLVHPNLTSLSKMSGRVRSKSGGVSTLEIWPWKYLVPWMTEDLFSRREARRRRGAPYVYGNDSYDMEEIVMPLHEYINHPVAMDLIHNGATFQVAGLTNNSNIRDAHELRQCVITHPILGKFVLEVAKKRLDDMLYVGITEDQRQSATMFANVVGAQVISQLMESSKDNNTSEQSPSNSDSNIDTPDDQDNSSSTVEAKSENMTVGNLMETYETCVSSLRSSQSQRRTASLKRLSPANFTKEARRRIPDALLKEIISLNSLDLELYKHAKEIFQRQHQNMEQELQDSVAPEKWHMMLNNIGSWTVIYIFGFTFLLFFICFYRSAKRRISKIKTKHNVQESLLPSPEARATRSISDKLQRRLAQNREAARKSRLRKKAYVQQLESGRIKLAQLEQELERARRQSVYGGLVSTSNVINPRIVTFEMEYDLWLEEQRKNDDELRKVLMTYMSETDLRLFVNSGFNHYYNLFRMKAIAAKADVFYMMNGLWRTPVERFFQWIGGFQPSQLLYILMPQIELMDLQLVKVTSLRQSCEQAEEALTQGMEKLQQNLAQSITIDITSAGSYNMQMKSAMEKLEALEVFLIQADHLREETLQQLYLILTLPQAAKALLVLGEYFQRLRVLSSIWSARPRDPATVLS